jgi:hypothetical protein
MSKVIQCVNFFKANPTMTRSEMINSFVSQFGMTPAGASTYYSNAKRLAEGGSFHQTQPKDTISNETVDFDKEPPTTYWVLTIVNNVVDAIHGYFQRPSKIKEGQLITTDDVEIGQDISTLTLV